ncbi:MAG: 5-methyltetrahydropteroyltriglutamate--homocysteine methyltransferase [SAR202 cluster bacterium]|nr:5-methyltetrahydropteroyltriglutamate--homocysteine methyltransferase [Chloroflexota bacterium]MQG49183.1 5-methyltetrahydropteroyltriglutamate--homocysteine methyltransferase [SAR202 cluster bacterium]
MDGNFLGTTVVGSFPQPEWLIDRETLSHIVPRVRQTGLWRVSDEFLEAAQDDATLLAIGEMERAGVELITDGEIRRESYSNRFATALDGVDIENPGEVLGRSGQPTIVPRVVGPIKRNQPVQVRDVEFLRANTSRRIKVTVPGPFTMSQQVQNDHYPDRATLAMDYAVAVNQEVKALFAAGADVVQLDEPWLQAHADDAREFGVAAINKALEGMSGTTGLHLCFGYAAVVKNKASEYAFLAELEGSAADLVSIEAAQPNLDLSVLAKLPSKTMVVGVIDLEDAAVESPESVAVRVREALKYLPPEQLMLAPDCGMKYLPREVAFGKLQAMVQGVELVREELG